MVRVARALDEVDMANGCLVPTVVSCGAQVLQKVWGSVSQTLKEMALARWGGVQWQEELLCATCASEAMAARCADALSPGAISSSGTVVKASGSAVCVPTPSERAAELRDRVLYPGDHVPADVLALPPPVSPEDERCAQCRGVVMRPTAASVRLPARPVRSRGSGLGRIVLLL